MNKIIFIFVALVLQGCGAIECIDSQFSREVRPIDQEFNIELRFQEKNMNMSIRCEEYYDSMCAERGNYWTIREVGKTSQYQTSKFLFYDNELGEVEVPIPQCSNMVRGKKTPLEHIVLKINGENYWLVSSEGNKHTYRPSQSSRSQGQTLTLKLNLEVNGEPIN
jgi:hypothetical protein